MARADFHRGKCLHGSGHDPTASIARPGFFTTDQVGYADFYANSDAVNAVSDQGDIWAADPPTRPLDLTQGFHDAQVVLDLLQAEAKSYFRENKHRSTLALERALERAQAYIESEADVPTIDSSLRNTALEMGSLDGKFADITALYQVVKRAGYDALITLERHHPHKELVRVIIFMDRPALISHYREVVKAVAAGKPVRELVREDYPHLRR